MRFGVVLSCAGALLVVLGATGSDLVLRRSGEATAAQRVQPNIVVIETDDQTSEQMKVMRKTRRLIGRAGTTFDSSFVSLSLCCPSRASFLTGQYAHNHRVLSNGPPSGGYRRLDHKNALPVWLKRAGYWTALVGKYLNGYGSASTRTRVPPGWSEWHAGVTLSYFNYTMNDNGRLHHHGRGLADYGTDVYTQKAVDVIRRRAALEKPFFLWVTYHAPHAGGPPDADDPTDVNIPTCHPSPIYKDVFQFEPLPRPPSFNEADVSKKPYGIRHRPLLNPYEIAAVQEAYQQQLECLLSVDDGVEAIVEALQTSGVLGRTLVVFTDDNGYFHGEHRVPSGKVLPYEPSIRVPLLIRGPGVPRGLHLKQTVANVDLAPTIVAAAGAKPGRKMDGRSLFPLLHHPDRQWGRDLLIERGAGAGSGLSAKPGLQTGDTGYGDNGNRGAAGGPGDRSFSALRTPRFLYAEYSNGEKELYDLWNDPDELKNLHSDPSYAAFQDELHRRLKKLKRCAGRVCRAGPRIQLRTIHRTRRAPGGRCTSSDVKARVTGRDRPWVSAVWFFLNGRLLAVKADPPFAVRIHRRSLGRRPRIQARITFVDGRTSDRIRAISRACR